MTDVTDVQTLVQGYIDAWNETDPGRRRALIARVFAEDAIYTDPLASVRGYDGIDQLIAAAQMQFAGLQFTVAGPVDAHHNQARFKWHLGPANADEPIVIGFDVAIIENDRLRSVYGFLDKMPVMA